MRVRKELRKYQLAAIEFIKKVKRCALFVDPGLGKTAITATAFTDLIDELEISGITLIIGPPNVASLTWPDEFKEWAHLNGFSYVHIDGSVEKRRKLLKRRACFHIMSMELLPWLLNELGGQSPDKREIKRLLNEEVRDGIPLTPDELQENAKKAAKLNTWLPPKRMPYGAIVVDESSGVKEKNTNRWRALSLMAFRVEYFVELTGTPSANSLHDLWAQIYLLDRGERLGRTLTDFRNRWFVENWNGNGYKPKGQFVIDRIEERIADIVFTLREEDYADLPPKMYNTILLKFDEATEKKYRHFEKTYILEAVEKKIVVRDGAAITQKLMQLSNGVVYDEIKGEHFFHDIKLRAMERLIEEIGNTPLFVSYAFQSDVTRILAKFPGAVHFTGSKTRRREIKDEWNRGEIPILLAHPKSVAHGLNLQFGGNHALWYGLTWSLEQYIQLNKRLHRSGQTKPVMIHHLAIEGTMDTAALSALDGKNDTQEALLNALKKRVAMYTGKDYE